MEFFVLKRVKIEKGDLKEGLSIGMQNPRDSSVFWIFENVNSQGEFENIIKNLKENLEQVAREGEKIWRKIKSEAEGIKVLKPGMDPEEAWEILEKADEEEIFQLFNNLPERDRKGIANYVFTNKNVFKGKPLYFSQHYDYGSNLLIKEPM